MLLDSSTWWMSHSQCIPRTLLQVTSAPVCDHWIAKQGQYHVEVEFIPKPLMWLHIYETIYHCWLKDIGVLIRNSYIFTILEITWEAIFFITFPFCTSVKYGHEKDNNNDDNKNNDSYLGKWGNPFNWWIWKNTLGLFSQNLFFPFLEPSMCT